MPNADDFRKTLIQYFEEGEKAGRQNIVLTAGELHRRVGGYPGASHRMPVCYTVMRHLMRQGDEVILAPPSGKGASLKIRYLLPRETAGYESKNRPQSKTPKPRRPNMQESARPTESIRGKVVCFIPCCGSKVASGVTLDSKKNQPHLPYSICTPLLEARRQGSFAIETDSPKTMALELYTGSPYRTFGSVKTDLLRALDGATLRVYVMSAGYGVIDSREAIHKYNEVLQGRTARYWRDCGLQDMVAKILLFERPERFYGFFAGYSDWSSSSSKYRYFFAVGGKKAIAEGLDVAQAGCFYRLEGAGVGAILDALGRTFVSFFRRGFEPGFANDVERHHRQDGNVTIDFDRFR